jgi:hypothetical protein
MQIALKNTINREVGEDKAIYSTRLGESSASLEDRRETAAL